MMTPRRPDALIRATTCALLLALGGAWSAAGGQSAPVPAHPHPGPRIGLALSGGSARGLAHIGVLKALERAGIPIDAISGTSMGGLVGGLYAAGYSASDLETIAREIDWPVMFDDRPDRNALPLFERELGNPILLSLPMRGGRIGLPSGVVAGQHVSELFARLTWPVHEVRDFRRLPIPFSAIATDIATGEAVVLDSGSLAGAMRASMSIPSVFAPASFQGRMLLDGGLARNLPTRDVRTLGAEVVICSDVSEPLIDVKDLHSIVDILNQAIGFHGSESVQEERKGCDIYIRPDFAGLDPMSFNRTADWVARGDSATARLSSQLRALATVTADGIAPARPGFPDSTRAIPVQLTRVVVDAATPEARAFILNTLDLPTPLLVDPDRMTRAVLPAYASGLFQTVTYALVRTDSGTTAVVSAQGDNADRIGFGFRYDDRYNAALLFDATVRNLLGFGSTGRVSLRLGEQTRLAVDVARGRAIDSHWVLGTGASYLSTPLDFFEGRRRSAEATLRVASANLTVGGALRRGAVALQLKGEDVYATAAIAAVDSSHHRAFASAAALLWWDTMGAPDFATHGAMLRARYERGFWGGAPFTRTIATGSAALPIASHVSLLTRATVGASTRDATIPIHYRFFLGSLTSSVILAEAQVPFAGLHMQERTDFAVAQAGAAVQWEAVPNVFASLRADVGNVGPGVSEAIDTRIAGAGFSLGSRTLIGPVQVTVHGRSPSTAMLEINIGHVF
jgi:NTE family protein